MPAAQTHAQVEPKTEAEADAEDAAERARRHSPEELSCLAVQFPPFFVSTRGLSRPATPVERHLARYQQIVQHSIDEKLIWPLTEHTVCCTVLLLFTDCILGGLFRSREVCTVQ